MKKVVRMKAVELKFDYNLYARQRIDPYHVNEMVEGLKAGSIFPPVVADSASKRIVDGFHRVRALLKLYKEQAEVDVFLKDYGSEAEMYEDAMKFNSTHGRNLTSYDKAHCILRARELGLSDETISKALKLTTNRIASLIQERWTAEEDVLKRTMAHFAGKEITAEQRAFISKAGGMDQLFYIHQVVALLETDSIDWDRESVVKAIKKLQELLNEKLAVKVAA